MSSSAVSSPPAQSLPWHLIAFSSDGQMMAIVSGWHFFIFNVETRALVVDSTKSETHAAETLIRGASFNPVVSSDKSLQFATVGDDKSIRIWNITEGSLSLIATHSHSRRLLSAIWASSLLITDRSDALLRCAAEGPAVLYSHTTSIITAARVVGGRLISGDRAGWIRVNEKKKGDSGADVGAESTKKASSEVDSGEFEVEGEISAVMKCRDGRGVRFIGLRGAETLVCVDFDGVVREFDGLEGTVRCSREWDIREVIGAEKTLREDGVTTLATMLVCEISGGDSNAMWMVVSYGAIVALIEVTDTARIERARCELPGDHVRIAQIQPQPQSTSTSFSDVWLTGESQPGHPALYHLRVTPATPSLTHVSDEFVVPPVVQATDTEALWTTIRMGDLMTLRKRNAEHNQGAQQNKKKKK